MRCTKKFLFEWSKQNFEIYKTVIKFPIWDLKQSPTSNSIQHRVFFFSRSPLFHTEYCYFLRCIDARNTRIRHKKQKIKKRTHDIEGRGTNHGVVGHKFNGKDWILHFVVLQFVKCLMKHFPNWYPIWQFRKPLQQWSRVKMRGPKC
jgi:hypothetical protein